MLPVLVHVISVLLAFTASFVILFSKKGTKKHKVFGWVFTLSMFTSTISSFWIKTSGSFSFIHILSIATIYWLVMGVYHARKRSKNWQFKHAQNMTSAYISILIARAGAIVRHYISPGNSVAGGIASGILAVFIIPLMILSIMKYRVKSTSEK